MEQLESLIQQFQNDPSVSVESKQQFIDTIRAKQSQLSAIKEKHSALLNELNFAPPSEFDSDSVGNGTSNSNSGKQQVDYESLDGSISQHISRLKTYNELKDTALKMISIIATQNKSDINQTAKELEINMNDDDEVGS